MDRPFGQNDRRYAVRVTGPAGHSRYIAIGGVEDDRIENAFAYRDGRVAWEAATHYQRTHNNVVCDVVNLDDPEAQCPV